MDATEYQPRRRKAAVLATACIALALWSSSCGGGGGSTPIPVSTAGFSVTPTAISYGNQAVNTASPAQSATLVNVGNAALSISNIQVTGANAGDYSLAQNCGSSLAPTAQCTLSLTFTPSAAGARSASVVFTDNAAGSPQTVSMTGTGISGEVGLSTTALTFGSQSVGTSTSAQAVTLTNNGNGALSVASVAVAGANPGDFAQSNNCGNSVAAGGSCAINVTFSPTTTGSRAATLTIANGAAGSPQTVSLTGTGTGPTVSLSTSSLTFSQNLGTASAGQPVTLTNSGNAALSIAGIAVTGANAAAFAETNTCGVSVAAGSSCTIMVTFTPSFAGSYSAAVSITDNAPGNPQAVNLTGTGVGTAAVASLSTANLTFGSQSLNTTSAPLPITLSNTGNAALTYTPPIPVAGTNSGDFSESDTCGGSVAAGSNCKISVAFTPSGTGARSASITFTSNASNSPQIISLSGTGTSSVVSLSSTGLTFPSQTVGTTSAAQIVTLTNTGNTSLGITSVAMTGTNGGDFDQTNTCGSSVAAGGNCTITVTFAPAAIGPRTAAVSIADNATGSPQTVSLTGTGGGAAVTLTATSLIFGSQNLGTTSAVQAVTLSNTGNTTLNITGLTLAGANPGDFGQSNSCGTSVLAGGNCTISVTFAPTVPGSRSASLTVADNAPGSPQTVTLTGTGSGPVVGLSPSTLSYSSQSVGSTSAAQAVTLTNSGNATLNISSILATGANAGDFAATSTCSSSVGPGGTCTVSVTFAPTAPGTRTASVTITDNASSSPQAVSLTGTGSAPLAGVATTSLTFNGQNLGSTSAAQTVTLNNAGNQALSITGVGFSGSNPGDFTQTNTCGSSLASSGSCTISVAFSPTAAGIRTATLTITDNSNNTAGSQQSVSLTGTGNGPSISLTPTALTFGSQTQGTTSAIQSITLTNTGNASLTFTSITVTGTNAGDFAQTNTCGTSLAPNGTCTINATFTPSTSGGEAAALSFTDNAPGSPQSAALTGTGISGQVNLSPSNLTFAGQMVGTTSTAQSVTLKNTGSASFTITSITVAGANPGDFSQTNGCGGSLAVNATCTIVVKFLPTALGVRTGTVSIADSLAGSPQTVALTGTGTGPAVSLTPASLTFAGQNLGVTSAVQSVTLTNPGTATLTITSIAATGANAGDFAVTNTCGSSVAVNGSCSISVTFTPSAIGSRAASVTVTDNAGGSPQTVSLSGTGSAPAASLAPTSLTFNNQNLGTTSAAQTVTLTNIGNASLSISSITFTGANPGDFADTTTCGGALASGGSCTFNVTFAPSAAGTRAASLTVTDNSNDVPGSQQLVSLTGTGMGPSVSLSPATLPFGNQTLGTSSAAQNITLTNTGNATLTLTSISLTGANPGDYAQTNTCGSSLAANASCTISVEFTPAACLTRTAAISIVDNASGSPQPVTLTGTGTGSVASLSAVSLTFGPQTLLTTSPSQAFTLTNTGNLSLTLTSISITGSNAGDFGQSNTCPFSPSSLAAGGSCTVTATFTPSASGSRTASISIADNATAGSPQAVSLVGTGITGVVGLSTTTLSFGSQSLGTTSATQTVTLTNGGSSALTISGIQIAGTNPGDYAMPGNTCGTSLAMNASCQVSVNFTPTTAGSRTASLTFTDSATNSPQTVSLTGTGTAPLAGLSPSSYPFGNQPISIGSNAATFTLSNTGTATLNIAGVALTGTNPGDFSQNSSCGSTLAAGNNCAVAITFTPTAVGSRSASLVVTDNSNNVPGTTQTATLTGTGLHNMALSWTASATTGVMGYYVYRGPSPGGEGSTPLNSTPVNATNYLDVNVTTGATYYYVVTSVGSDGVTQSLASTEVHATVPTP